LILHQVALSETVYVLMNIYQVSSKDVAQILEELLEMPGAQPENEISWPTLFDLWPDSVADYGDAALATVARQGRYEVATFDAKFARKLAQQKIPTRW
jgi:predicted nucleic-acid-binding protein